MDDYDRCLPPQHFAPGKMEDPLTNVSGHIHHTRQPRRATGPLRPCGFDRKGLPIGLQIIGKPLDEGLMLQAAHVCESELQLKKIPTVCEQNSGRWPVASASKAVSSNQRNQRNREQKPHEWR
jgi:hypothetical protein